MSAISDRLAGLLHRLTGRAGGQPRFSEAGQRVREQAIAHRHMPGPLAELIAQYPGRPQALIVRGETELEEGAAEAALETAAMLRARFPALLAGWQFGCAALRRLGRFAEAEALSRQAIRRFPAAPGAYEAFAFAAQEQGDWAQAAPRWLAAARRFPETQWVRCMAAVALARQGQADQAEAAIATAVRHWPEDFWPRFFAAEIAELAQDWETAGARWVALSRRFPGRTEPYLRGTIALRQAGATDQARALADAGLFIFPNAAALKAEQAKL